MRDMVALGNGPLDTNYTPQVHMQGVSEQLTWRKPLRANCYVWMEPREFEKVGR